MYFFDLGFMNTTVWIALKYISTVIYRLFQVINNRNPIQGLHVTVSRNIINYRGIEL